MAGLTFQGPYIYKRYLDAGMTQNEISIIMSVFNIVSSFWGFFVGYFQEILGHKQLIIISALLLSIHATLRFIGGFRNFVLAAAVMGCSTSANRVVFEDWLMTVLQNSNAPPLAQATIQENSNLIRLFSTLIMTPLSANLVSNFGTSSAFIVSSLLFFTSATIISIFLEDTKQLGSDGKKREKIGYIQALKLIFNSIKSSKELVLLLLIDFSYGVFLLLYTPRWLAMHQITKKDSLPLSQMSSTNGVALMNGAQILGAILQYMSTRVSILLSTILYTLSILLIIFFFANKNIVYTFYIISALCDGGFNTVLRIAKLNVYPREIRGYILGFLKVPTSLCVSLTLMLLKGKDVIYILYACLSFLILCSISSIFFYKFEKQPVQNQ